MLQITTGKFFSGVDCFETLHRGTFYTNYRGFQNDPIETPVGRLLPSTGLTGLSTLTYEVIEKIERSDPLPGTLVSTGGKELIDDLAVVLSFTLNMICTTDSDLLRRLTAADSPESNRINRSQKYLRRVFDKRVNLRPEDVALINDFIVALVGLKRASYEGAIRAIRRYVTATHRIADDSSLAYGLFVMSIEALAQASDAPLPSWLDYDESKRDRIDTALNEAPAEVADRVRSAVLENEHVALSRRFRDFAMQHLSPTFFRQDAADCVRPIRRPDLVTLLKRAYDIRSGYVHRLEAVPKLLSIPFDHGETFAIDDQPTLTFEGLARLARHVIKEFVKRAPKIEHEHYDWRSALPNVVTMKLGSQYWIARPEVYMPETAAQRLQAFLIEISSVLLRPTDAALTDLSAILDKIEQLPLDSAKPCQRRAMLTLYHLFTTFAGPKYQRTRHQELLSRYEADYREPCIERLAICLLAWEPFPWPLETIEKLHESYYRTRHHKRSLLLPELLEAMLTLRLAEDYRLAGNETRARELLTFAVEAFPSNAAIRALENSLGAEKLSPIAAKDVLLPHTTQGSGKTEELLT
jgi:hypothetical protein